MAALAFVATLIVLDPKFKEKKYYHIILGLLFGLIPLVKINGAMITFVLNIIYLWQNLRTKTYRRIIINWSIQIILLTLLFVRNWYYYGAPFFPVFLNIFPGQLTPSMINNFTHFMASKTTWATFVQNITIFFTAKLVLLSAPIFFLLNMKNKEWEKNFVFIVSLLIFSLLMLKSGGMVYERWFFTCYFLNLYFIFFSWKQIGKSTVISFIILIALIIDSRLDQSLKRIKNLSSKYQNIESFSEKNRMWRHIPKNALILSDRWNEFFHAPSGVRIHSSECTFQAGFLDQCSTKDVEKVLVYDYAILAKPNINPCYALIKSRSNVIEKIDGYELYKIK
jgi:hypothetical protein